MAQQPARRKPGSRLPADKTYNPRPALVGPDVPEQWLDEFEDSDEARDLQARLGGDLQLFNRLALENFEGPGWDLFSDAVMRYGYSVMTGWIRSGQVFAKVKEKNLGGLQRPPLQARWKGDAASIAGDTVTDALLTFRDKVLRQGKWTYTGGATLKTFYIGMCLSCFRNAWRRWYGEEFGDDYMNIDLTDHPEKHTTSVELSDPAYIVEKKDEYQRTVDFAVTDQQRTVLEMTAFNYRQTEIAMVVGSTPKAVEMTLRRVKQNARENQ